MSHGSPFSASQLYSNANASVTAEVRRDIKFLIDTEVLTTTPETNNEVVTRLAEHIRNGSSEIVLETLKPNFKYGSLEYQLRMLNLLNECVIHSGPQFIALLSGEKWLDRIFKVAKTTNSAQLRDKIMINTIQWYNQSHTSGLQRLMGRFSHSNKLGVHFRAVVSDLTKRSQSIQSQSDNFFESGHHQQTFDTITEPNPNEALETEETMLLQFQGDLASLEYALEHPQFLEDTDSAQDCKNNKLVCMRMLESGQHERIASELMSLIERISETLELYEAMTGKDMDEGELSRNRGAGVSAMDDDLAESDSDDDLQQQQIRNLRAKKKMKGSRVDANRLLAEAQQNNNALAENERAETERLRTELTELRRKHEELQNKFKSAKAKNKEAISMLEQYASEVESLQKGNKANNAATALPVASPRSSISADKVEHLGEKVSSLRIDLRELRESMGEGVRKEANYYRTQLMAAMASVVKAAQNDREADQRTLQWTQELYRKEMKLRKQYYNTIQELKGNIRVFCRVRPMIPMELKDGHTDVMTYPSPDTIRFVDATGRFKSFEFDEVYNPQVPQLKVFEDTAPLIDSVVDGFNVCIFAYGQTGSGKTYTMSGGEDEAKGINTRALERLFAIIEDRKYTEVSTVTLSVLEIYCEQINDLLVSKRVSASTNYDIKQGGPHGTYVTNLTEVPVNSPREIHRIMEMANKNRSEGTTNMNEHSSRSHMLLYIVVRTKNVQTNIESFGKLSLVDLAGSERLDKSGAEGQMLKETVAINKSLSSLGDVIAGLVQNARHIPFRNSTLTFLLQDSMAGQAKVLMFVCIGPASYNVSESSNSLQFASRARGVAFGQIKKNQAIERK